MAYNSFAYWYDRLNVDVDYDRLACEVQRCLEAHGVPEGIVADLGCGTGELTLRLSRAGYDMIAVDASPDMLSILREKLEGEERGEPLLLSQSLESLDLFGTIRAAVATFDTFNHLPLADLKAALGRVSLFTEAQGVLVFDVNTPYKHEHILGDNLFETDFKDDPGICFEWENQYNPDEGATLITVTMWKDEEMMFTESFNEYCYTLSQLESLLEAAGYRISEVIDGEIFTPPTELSQRLMITAVKN